MEQSFRQCMKTVLKFECDMMHSIGAPLMCRLRYACCQSYIFGGSHWYYFL